MQCSPSRPIALRQRFLHESGMSLIELMIAIAIGLVVLAALSMLFVQNSANRREIDRSASVLENGRYALSILKDELSLAGYYGTLSVPSGTAVPCSKVISDWSGSLAIPAQGINNNDADLAGCVSATPATLPARKGNTDAIVIQRTSTCVAGTTDCAAPVAANAYLQVSECGTEYLTTPFVLALGTGDVRFEETGREQRQLRRHGNGTDKTVLP